MNKQGEKALCDKIIMTPGIFLRSQKQTMAFLAEDLRIAESGLKKLDAGMINTWVDDAPRKSSLNMLAKTLQAL